MRKIISGRRGNVREQFTFTVSTGSTSSDTTTNTQFKLPISSATPTGGGALGFKVFWGDGTSDIISASNFSTATLHTYASQGIKTIKITGPVRGWCFANMSSGSNDAIKLIEISKWGDYRFTEKRAFEGCSIFNRISALDTPWFEVGTSGERAFYNCGKLTQIDAIKNWNVYNLTTTKGMFERCGIRYGSSTSSEADISGWKVDNITDMSFMFSQAAGWRGRMFNITSNTTDISAMFQFCKYFNDDSGNGQVVNWNVSKVTDMSFCFSTAEVFNQDISGWNTISCQNMRSMFAGNGGSPMAFNQPIGSWNTSNVRNINNIFTFCDSFDQDLSGWNLSGLNQYSATTPPLTQAIGSFGLSTSNYDSLLVAWDAYTYPGIPANSTFNFGSSTYSLGSAAATARASLITKWGGITDGGGV